MTQERIEEALIAWSKIADACAASINIDWILNESKDAESFYCFEIENTELGGVSYWVNVDDILCVEVYRNKGDKEWAVSSDIEIIDDKTNDWDGIHYNILNL